MRDQLARIDFSKNQKLGYYMRSYFHLLLPNRLYRNMFSMAALTPENQAMVFDRLNYYHQWNQPFELDESATTVNRFRRMPKKKTYFFDLYQYIRMFPEARFSYLFGDIRHVPEQPSFVKSRPISSVNQASILFNLNKVRHFVWAKDPLSFAEKQPQLVWRGGAYRPHRIAFLEQYIDHPLCNVGQTNHCKNNHLAKERMTIEEQLHYRYILSLEGNDVASNLKWAMSSNSLVMMPRPQFESWFMEGRLQPGVHYCEIRSDYADVADKIRYYQQHPWEAEAIIENAHQWVRQFQNEALENTIAMAVIGRYLYLSTRTDPVRQGLPHLPARPALENHYNSATLR